MSSDTASLSSQSTDASISKPLLPTTSASSDASSSTSSVKAPRRRLRHRLRTALSDMGTPPTTRYDAAHGIETPRHVDLGLLVAVSNPART